MPLRERERVSTQCKDWLNMLSFTEVDNMEYSTDALAVAAYPPLWKLSPAVTHIYTFDDVLTDSGSGTTRSLTDEGTITYAAGKLGNAASFDGSSDRLAYADNEDFEVGTDDFTVCGWLNETSYDRV
jgi:hypothetical protein